MADLKMSPWDHVLVHTLQAVILQPWSDDANDEMLLAVLSDACHHATAEAPQVRRLLEIGERIVLQAKSPRRQDLKARSEHEARLALHAFHMWRLGEAQAFIRRRTQAEEEAA